MHAPIHKSIKLSTSTITTYSKLPGPKVSLLLPPGKKESLITFIKIAPLSKINMNYFKILSKKMSKTPHCQKSRKSAKRQKSSTCSVLTINVRLSKRNTIKNSSKKQFLFKKSSRKHKPQTLKAKFNESGVDLTFEIICLFTMKKI